MREGRGLWVQLQCLVYCSCRKFFFGQCCGRSFQRGSRKEPSVLFLKSFVRFFRFFLPEDRGLRILKNGVAIYLPHKKWIFPLRIFFSKCDQICSFLRSNCPCSNCFFLSNIFPKIGLKMAKMGSEVVLFLKFCLLGEFYIRWNFSFTLDNF